MRTNNQLIDLTGKKFGEITVKKRAPNAKVNSRARWVCECSCGTIKIMRGDVLRSGVKSCGCKNPAYKHGGCVGERPSRLYVIWRDMKARCGDPGNIGFHLYGGRGISVCPEWLDSFSAFHKWATENGYSDELTIDRIDNNGNYSPENCRWATEEEQQNNKRNTVFVTVHGKRKSISEWAKLVGDSPAALRHRRYRGTLQDYLESKVCL